MLQIAGGSKRTNDIHKLKKKKKILKLKLKIR